MAVEGFFIANKADVVILSLSAFFKTGIRQWRDVQRFVRQRNVRKAGSGVGFSEDRCQRSDNRGQMTENRRQISELSRKLYHLSSVV